MAIWIAVTLLVDCLSHTISCFKLASTKDILIKHRFSPVRGMQELSDLVSKSAKAPKKYKKSGTWRT